MREDIPKTGGNGGIVGIVGDGRDIPLLPGAQEKFKGAFVQPFFHAQRGIRAKAGAAVWNVTAAQGPKEAHSPGQLPCRLQDKTGITSLIRQPLQGEHGAPGNAPAPAVLPYKDPLDLRSLPAVGLEAGAPHGPAAAIGDEHVVDVCEQIIEGDVPGAVFPAALSR